MNILQCKQVFHGEHINMYMESKIYAGFEMCTVRRTKRPVYQLHYLNVYWSNTNNKSCQKHRAEAFRLLSLSADTSFG
jgi:hypothetical protein